MRRWKDCRTEAERRSAIEEALSAAGTVKAAAPLLGMNRQYLHEVMGKMAIRVGRVGSVGSTDMTTDQVRRGRVGPNTYKSLRCENSPPTFPLVSSVVAANDRMEKLSVEVPASIKERLEIAAAKKKRALGLDRPSMGPLVTEALSRYLDQEEAAAEEREEGGSR